MNIEPGCEALIISGAVPENIGKSVKVGNCIGQIPGFVKAEFWEVSPPLRSTFGRLIGVARREQLMRIDGFSESERKECELAV